MKRVLKYIAITLAGLVALVVLLCVAVYIPFVQRAAVNYAQGWVAGHTDMDVRVGGFSLRPPLTLSLDDVVVRDARGDTLAAMGCARVRVKLLPLLKRRVEVRSVTLGDVKINYLTPDGTMDLDVVAHKLAVAGADVDLAESHAAIERVALQGAQVALGYRAAAEEDTTATEPLAWALDIAHIDLDDIACEMYMPPIADTLRVVLPQACINDGSIALQSQQVRVGDVTLTRGDYRFVARSAAEAVDATETDTVAADTTALPWEVRVGRVTLADNRVAYITADTVAAQGFDAGNIVADGINIGIGDVYNRGSEVSLQIDSLSLRERCGLAVTRGRGRVAMRDNRVEVDGLELFTPYSDLHVDADVDLSFLDGDPAATLYGKIEAHVGLPDAELFNPGVKSLYVHPQPSPVLLHEGVVPAGIMEYISARVEVQGNSERLAITTCDLQQPGIFVADVTGEVRRVWDESRRAGELQARLKSTRALSLHNFVSDSTLLQRIDVPPLELTAHAAMAGSVVDADALVTCLDGVVDLVANYDMRREAYEAKLSIDRFPLDSIMPRESMGPLTARAYVQGRHFAPTDTATAVTVELAVDTFSYLSVPYNDIAVNASLAQQRWQLHVDSKPYVANMQLSGEGIYSPDLIYADMKMDIGMLDLALMRFVDDTLNVSGQVVLTAVASSIDSLMQADVTINDLSLGMGAYRYKAGSIGCVAASDITYSYVDVSTGDARLNVSADVGLQRLQPSLERLMQFADTVLLRQRLNMDELHEGLPPFVIDLKAGRNNIVQQYLNSRDIKFTTLTFNAHNDSLFGMDAYVHQLIVSGTQLDTITFLATEANERLNYNLALNNKPGNLDEVAHVGVDGFLSGNSTRLLCTHANRKGETGLLLGCKIDFVDSLVNFAFGPAEPIIGYKNWHLNRGNYLSYNHVKKKLGADIQLTYGDSRFYVSTDTRRNPAVEGVHLDIKNIKIGDWLVASALLPPIDGVVSADVYVDLPATGIEAAGDISIGDLMLARRRVGSFDLEAQCDIDTLGVSSINATLGVDDARVMDAVAQYNARNKGIEGTLTIDKFPLAVADALLPQGMANVEGAIASRIEIGGTANAPRIDGFLRLEDTRIAAPKMGLSLAFSDKDIVIDRNIVRLNSYGITGHNGSALNINGTVDMTDFGDIAMKVDLIGRNFEPIHSAESRTAMLYGQVYTDVFARVQGKLSNLVARGRVSLLQGTNATYVMQSTTMQQSTDYSDMVTFVSFADTVETYEKIAGISSRSGVNVNASIDIEIDEGVQLGVNLSTDGNNRIDLVGGGSLLYTMTALGDNRFTGRYNLTGGFVRYNPPILSQKIFNIKEGSYVLWTGDIADPTLNITAVQTQKSSVSDGDKGSRPVEFDITIYVTNRLENLGISFDLATTDDLTIGNELQSLTAEQRSSKAMNMLLYNSYTTISSASDLNPLNTFLESEINAWAQKTLKGVDLTFGIDNYGDDGTGTQRTDYSYKFSKSLFDNRLKVVVGGSYATNQDATQNLKENLIDDISLEYRLTKRENMYIKAFRHTGYESIIEGEITQTGVGFLYRKQLASLIDLFRKKRTVLPAARPAAATEQPADSIAPQPAAVLPDSVNTTRKEGDRP